MVDLPHDDDFLGIVRRETSLLQRIPGGLDLLRRKDEEALDAGLPCLGAYEPLVGALAQQQANGVDNDGLAGTRLACEDVEAWRKGKLQVVYQSVIFNV